MNGLSDAKTLALLRDAMTTHNEDGPRADLWPRVRHRIEGAAGSGPAAGDWVLAAALVLLCLLRPALVGVLLLHF